jgi:hypothetical protein
MPTIFNKNSSRSYNQLVSLIKHTRKQMIHSASTSGLTSQETVEISQQLDYLLNLEHKQRQQNK